MFRLGIETKHVGQPGQIYLLGLNYYDEIIWTHKLGGSQAALFILEAKPRLPSG